MKFKMSAFRLLYFILLVKVSSLFVILEESDIIASILLRTVPMYLYVDAGERRIRVHTMCLPIASNVTEVIQSADQQCIIGLLAKMGRLSIALDRTVVSHC